MLILMARGVRGIVDGFHSLVPLIDNLNILD